MAHVSASQIETFEMCSRKWGFRYLDGIKTESTPAAAFGTEGHGVAERYLSSGKIEGEADIVPLIQRAKIRGFLPEPSDGLLLEHKFNLKHGVDDYIIGYIDCLIPGDIPIIIDHKFTKSARYAKTEETLKGNVQSVLYSYAVFEMYPEVNEVVNRWIYYIASGSERPRKPSGIRNVEIVRYRDEIRKCMGPVFETIGDIFKLKKMKKRAMDLVPDYTACSAFGGCPFSDICQKEVSANARFSAIMRQSRFHSTAKKEKKEMGKEDILAKLKAKQKEKGAKEVNAEPEEKDAKEKLAKLKAKKNKETKEEPKKEKKTVKDESSGEKLILLLNATVSKANGWGKVTQLSDLLRPIMEEVAKETEKAHWALVDFGKGKGFLATTLDNWLDDTKWKGVLQVETSSPEAQAVMEVLIANADVVVRGHA